VENKKSIFQYEWKVLFLLLIIAINLNNIPIQYIAKFIKNLGYEGIKINSSFYKKGRNITIFNYDKCELVSSKLYEIDDTCFEGKGIAPKNEKSLVHEKFLHYKQKNLYGFLINLKANKKD
jgi:hypothetical protein